MFGFNFCLNRFLPFFLIAKRSFKIQGFVCCQRNNNQLQTKSLISDDTNDRFIAFASNWNQKEKQQSKSCLYCRASKQKRQTNDRNTKVNISTQPQLSYMSSVKPNHELLISHLLNQIMSFLYLISQWVTSLNDCIILLATTTCWIQAQISLCLSLWSQSSSI